MTEAPLNQHAPRVIPVANPRFDHNEERMVVDCLRRRWISQGKYVELFEQEFAEAHGKKYGVACNSGTTALHLALAALDTGPDDTVLCPTLTMVAVGNAIRYTGATPHFVDSWPEDGNPNFVLRDVAGTIHDAAIVSHLYGQPAKLPYRPCSGPIIEDASEAHYSKGICDPKTWMTTFSFYANKIITCGEGGMVLTDEPDLAERLRSLRAHAFTPGRHFVHQELAFSYRMTDLQAAVGLAQHRRHDSILAQRHEIAHWYHEALAGMDWLEMPHRHTDAVWWVYPLVVGEDSRKNRDDIRNALAERGIESRSYFVPLHQQPHLARFGIVKRDPAMMPSTGYPVAERLSRDGFYLPLWPGMTREDVRYIADCLSAIQAA